MRPWNIAHRGGAQARPENTLAAFGYAATCDYDGVELDVQLTHDGEVVVFHDYRLKPELCRDEKGRWLVPSTPRLKDLTLAELKKFDVGRADPSYRVDDDGAYEHHPDDELLPVDVDAQERQGVGDEGHEEDAEEGPEDRARAALEARTAQNDRRYDAEFPAGARLAGGRAHPRRRRRPARP